MVFVYTLGDLMVVLWLLMLVALGACYGLIKLRDAAKRRLRARKGS